MSVCAQSHLRTCIQYNMQVCSIISFARTCLKNIEIGEHLRGGDSLIGTKKQIVANKCFLIRIHTCMSVLSINYKFYSIFGLRPFCAELFQNFEHISYMTSGKILRHGNNFFQCALVLASLKLLKLPFWSDITYLSVSNTLSIPTFTKSVIHLKQDSIYHH